MASLLSVLVVVVIACLLGGWMERALLTSEDGSLDRWARRFVVGIGLIFGVLLLLDLLSIRWTRVSLWLVVCLIALGLWLWQGVRRLPVSERVLDVEVDEGRWGRGLRMGWGDWAATLSVVLYGWIAAGRKIGLPDFVYHWGIKAHRSFLAGGVDWAFLGDRLNLAAHPDYPHLVPTLSVLSSLVVGRFDEVGAMLWSVVFFMALCLAGREALRRSGVDSFSTQAGIAVLALVVAMFGVGYRMAGAADWLLALALVVALPALLAPRGRADDLRVSAAAALAAAAKIEGPFLAILLLVVWIVLRWKRNGWSGPRVVWMALLPAALGVPWLVLTVRHGLFQVTNSGAFDLSRAPTIATALVEVLQTIEWHGVPWLLLALPWVAVVKRTRTAALVIGGQVAFYVAVYFTAPVDVDFYVRSSFPRLLFHLIPALLIVCTVALAGSPRSTSGGTESS